MAGVHNHTLGDLATIAGLANSPTQIVVVGQLIGKDSETADLVQHVAAERDGGAETGMGHAQPQPRQNIGQKLIIDPHGRQPRPQRCGRRARIKAGHKAQGRIGEGGDHLVQIGAPDADIAIRHHHHLAADRRLHIDQVADLAIFAMQPIIDHQRYIDAGIGPLKLANDPDSLIADIMNAANDLNSASIVLEAKTLQVGVQTRLRTVKGFQDRNKRQPRPNLALHLTPEIAFDLAAGEKRVSGAYQSKR